MAEPQIPDLLMRFSPTPFDWTLINFGQATRIESNDLKIALALKQALSGLRGEGLVRKVGHFRLVVDQGIGYGGIGPTHSVGPLQLDNGPVRTLLYGAGTVLLYDFERRELLGFLGQDVTTSDLLERFVPFLLEATPVWLHGRPLAQ